MTILHTADWHLGRTLFGAKRYREFASFLKWLLDALHQREVDVLLVAGDIFDTTTPGNRAQELYYRFLHDVAVSPCRHVVIIGGNHDSPSFLDAPGELLRSLHVHVVGSAPANPQDEVLVLRDPQGHPELLVCAVPYLRDRDIRTAEAGESMEDKDRKLKEGIRRHYTAVGAHAEYLRKTLGYHGDHQAPGYLPIVGMGHLFAAGGSRVEGDGVRELYVGSLAHVGADVFPGCFDYVALGHLHVPQMVGGVETIRYSGSPVAMGFGEAGQRKSVSLVHVNPAGHLEVEQMEIPVFQELVRLTGNWNAIAAGVRELAARESCGWLEVTWDGDDIAGDLRERLEEELAGTALEVLRVRNNRVMAGVLSEMAREETLQELTVHDVFERCLAAHHIPGEQRQELLHAYSEIVTLIGQHDERAE